MPWCPATPPTRLCKLVNPFLVGLLPSPRPAAVSGRLALLEFRGRRSGKRYAFPVGYVRVGDTLLIGTETAWKRNLRDAAPATVWVGGERRAGAANRVNDEEGRVQAYRTFFAKWKGFGRHIGVRTAANGEPNRAAVARAGGRSERPGNGRSRGSGVSR